MKKFYLIILSLLMTLPLLTQTHFNKGYDMSFNTSVICSPNNRDMSFGKLPWDTAHTYVTGGGTACSGGLKHLTKVLPGGGTQSMLNFECGVQSDIDFTTYPYLTIKIQTTCNKNLPMSITLKDGTLGSISKSFTVPGDSQWHIIRLDFGDQAPISTGTASEMHWFYNELALTSYPYEIYIDYILFGGKDRITFNTGDPDSTVKLGIDAVAKQYAEKDAGEQPVNLTGITNGTDVSFLSLTQTNTKATIFEGVPTFSTIQPDGTATMNFTPKAGTVGVSTVHLILNYNRGDTIKKYKSIWFDINIVADPKMTVPSNVNGLVNQPIVNINVSSATNSTGGASGLTLEATATNTDLITNLIASTIKSDGSSKISFIPGQDICGTDTITAVITDTGSKRSKTYKILATISSATCIPVDTGDGLAVTKKQVLRVTPNPASDLITVTMPVLKGGKLIITDIAGKTVKEVIVPAGQEIIQINVSQLEPGAYFISESIQGSSQKLIIK